MWQALKVQIEGQVVKNYWPYFTNHSIKIIKKYQPAIFGISMRDEMLASSIEAIIYHEYQSDVHR